MHSTANRPQASGMCTLRRLTCTMHICQTSVTRIPPQEKQINSRGGDKQAARCQHHHAECVHVGRKPGNQEGSPQPPRGNKTLAFLSFLYDVYQFFFKYLKKTLPFIFGCARSLLLLRLFSSCREWGLPSGCGARGGFSCCRAQAVGHVGSEAVVHRASCSQACGVLPRQGLNLCLLHRQVDSLPLSHRGSPRCWAFVQSDAVLPCSLHRHPKHVRAEVPLSMGTTQDTLMVAQRAQQAQGTGRLHSRQAPGAGVLALVLIVLCDRQEGAPD